MGSPADAELDNSGGRYTRKNGPGGKDQRRDAERDRDRVLYCSALRRLAGVTQVVGAVEGHLFHNRLTHTLEAAQIARRLAEKFVREQAALVATMGEINPDVVEAAALIHDLGHPPFGHTGENQLDQLARDVYGSEDGFEGNAQSFRIVTRLAAHRPNYKGLNLTRATLNGSLKYPWLRDKSSPKKQKKYGAYLSDRETFEWVRQGTTPDQKALEAEIMDLADDIAYSVHDLEDFLRTGLIPLEQLRNLEYLNPFIDQWATWATAEGQPQLSRLITDYRHVAPEWLANTFTEIRGNATFQERAALKAQTSGTIGKFVSDAKLGEPDSEGRAVLVSPESRFLMKFCQRLVWVFVISNPRLATIQYGQSEAIKNLLGIYRSAVADASQGRKRDLIPPRFLIELDGLDPRDDDAITRLAVDIVASLGDDQAINLHRRFGGIERRGSVTDIVHT